MSRTRATVLVPCSGGIGKLEGLAAMLEAQLSAEDECLLVDDTGEDVLPGWAEEHLPRARVAGGGASVGLAAAVARGTRDACGEVLVVLTPEVRMEEGCLDALVDALEDVEVGVAAPRFADGEGVSLRLDDGRLHRVPCDVPYEGGPEDGDAPRPVPFAPASLFAVRREWFYGPLDSLFVPAHWAEVDLGLRAWRAGLKVLEIPAARAWREEEADAASRLPEALARAAGEKNRLLTLWKHLDTRRDAHDHVASLWRDALDAAIAGRREELVWMALALQELPRVERARREMGRPERPLEEALRAGS